jgi:hypothetical protein
MKNPIITLFAFVTIILVSCKKEKSAEPGSGGGSGSAANLLMRQVTKVGNDSSVVVYTYDNSKRLISAKSTGVSGTNSYQTERKLIRNSQGIIQKYVDIDAEYYNPLIGADSIFYKVNYNAGSSRYTSKVLTITFGTNLFRDSIAYTYNTSGKIIKQEEFLDDGIGGGYMEYIKEEYTYDGAGNISVAQTSEFDDVSGTYNASYQLRYEYDNKANPLNLGNDAFIYGDPVNGDPSLASKNNATKVTYVDNDPSVGDEIYTFAYTYNAADKPISATQTLQSGGTPATVSYYYK